MRITEPEKMGSGDYSVGRQTVPSKAKKVLVGAGARVLFYPTLLYNVVRSKIQAEFRWWDEVDEFLLLGAVPFPRDVPRLKQLGVQGVVTLNEAYETLVSPSLYQSYGIDHLVIPTRDYLFAPSLVDIYRAVDFIHKNATRGLTTYVHCKAGRGRGTTIILCYLVKYKHMTPTAAWEHVRSIRPRVLLARSQWRAVQEFSKNQLELPAGTSYSPASPARDSPVTEPDIESCVAGGVVSKDLSTSTCKVARVRPIMAMLSCIFVSSRGSHKSEDTGHQLPEVQVC